MNCKINYILLIIFTTTLSVANEPATVPSAEYTIPYEQCNNITQGYTDMVTNQESVRDFQRCGRDFSSGTDNCDSRGTFAPAIQALNLHIEEICPDTHSLRLRDIPPICFYASMLRRRVTNAEIGGKLAGRENFYYCKKPSSKRISIDMGFSCENVENINTCHLNEQKANRYIYPRSFCLNNNYVNMTAKAFHEVADCFGFNSEETRTLFATYNHESAFLLNNRSHTDARCYAQITEKVHRTLNRYIYARNNVASYVDKEGANWYLQAGILNDAFRTCPNLATKVIPPEVLQFTNAIENYKIDSQITDPANFNCASTHDPYTCLFYSMYHSKIHTTKLNSNLRSDIESENERPFPKQFKPTNVNEVFIVEGSFKDLSTNQLRTMPPTIYQNLNDVERNLLYRPKEQCQTCLNQCRKNAPATDTSGTPSLACTQSCCGKIDPTNLTVKIVKVFPDNQLRNNFTQIAHNGGNTVANVHAQRFLSTLTRYISCESGCDDDTDSEKVRMGCDHCHTYRETILNGGTLDADVFHKEWERYVDYVEYEEDHDGDKDFTVFTNPDEVRSFAKKINRNMNFILTDSVTDENRSRASLKTTAKHFFKGRLTDTQVDEFVDQVQSQCTDILTPFHSKRQGPTNPLHSMPGEIQLIPRPVTR